MGLFNPVKLFSVFSYLFHFPCETHPSHTATFSALCGDGKKKQNQTKKKKMKQIELTQHANFSLKSFYITSACSLPSCILISLIKAKSKVVRNKD